jgi:hypothetical protein
MVLVRAKVERARKHLRDLAEEILAAGNVRTTVVGTNGDPKSGQALQEFVTLPRLPIDVVTTAGDVVHNLRSALDHLAFQLAIVGRGKEPSRRVEFPIAKDSKTYEAEKTRKVEGMLPEVISEIDRLRPYKGGNELLWKVHELDNIDKHRNLFSVDHDYLFYSDWFDGDYWLKTGAPNFASVFDGNAEHDTQIEIDTAVSRQQFAPGDSLLPSLRKLVDEVERVIYRFKQHLE